MDLYKDPLKIAQQPIKAVKSPIVVGLVKCLKGYPLVFIITAALIAGGLWAVNRKFPPIYRAEAKLFVAPLPPRVFFANDEWHKESIAGF